MTHDQRSRRLGFLGRKAGICRWRQRRGIGPRRLRLEPLEDRRLLTTWYVNDDAPGPTRDGSTWTNAFTDLQAALSAANASDEIWVAEGTYKPTPDSNRAISFNLKDNLSLYGGFAGTETDRSQRNWLTHVTTLSGDIGTPGDTNDNSYHVLYAPNIGSAVLDGFTVTGGRANGQESWQYVGGGLFNYQSSPTLRNVVFYGNSAQDGGGMYSYLPSSPSLANAIFINNSATRYGGGMANDYASPVLTNVVFRANSASHGGGMSNYRNSPTLTNVTFSGNSGSQHGGAMHDYGLSYPQVRNSILWGNTSPVGSQICDDLQYGGVTTVTYSIVQGGWPGGNLNQDPLFIDAAGGDLRPRAGSPAIDAGNNAAVPADITDLDYDGDTTESVPLDLDMVSRCFDIINVADTGSGAAPLVDMGAYERHNGPPVAEANGPYTVPELGIVSLSAAGSADPDGTLTFYEWDFDYNGITFDVDAAGMSPTFSAARLAGLQWRTVALRVTDSYGVVSPIDTTTVEITDAYATGYRFYVDSDVGGANDGTSWANAFTDLQSALTVADPGDEIWVAAGTYTPTADTNRGASFPLPSNVGVYGGFAGTETSRGQRNPAANVTTLSGDIGAAGDASDNSYHVVWALAASGATLDGFTITGGNADGAGGNLGGGMYNRAGSPTLANLVFVSNSAAYAGGGMYNYDGSSPTLTNVTFQGNSSGFGGGMVNENNSSPTLYNAVFDRNTAALDGGGIYNHDYSSPLLVNATLYGNNSGRFGGGMDSHGFCYPTVRNSILWANSASSAGAQIFNEQASSVNVDYSLVQDGWTGTGNLSGDPQFVDAAGGDFLLRMASPAVDAGTNSGAPTFDRSGRARPWDGNGDGTAVADMGAYERAVYFVNGQATGQNNGMSWANAFTGLQNAMAAAVSGDEVWIAAGSYRPTADTDRTISFNLKTLVNVYGGFAGTETSRDQRNGAAHPTTLSGEIGAAGNADNSYHVVRASGVTDAMLTDVTVTGGNAEYPDYCGGGMYAANSTLTLSRIVFDSNTSTGGYGGGLYNQSGSSRTLTLTDVTFRSNSATYYGGGMYNYYNSRANLTNVTFQQNSTTQYGGGMYNDQGSVLVLNNVIFRSNTAQSGGGLYNNYCTPSVSSATFIANSATYQGGAMYLRSSSPTVVNAVFSRNSADIGGGIYACNNSSPQLTNVSLSGNSARVGGGIYSYSNSYPYANNAIFWGNTATLWGPQIADEAYYRTTVRYSIVQGGWSGSNYMVQDVDPKFAAPLADDLHVASGSPAIDGGTTVSLTADRDGRARPQDGNADGSAAFDMGAYEYPANAILYVKYNATGLNNGTSWTNAFTDLQSALAAVNANDEIWVAAGTYTPTSGTDRAATFRLKSDISVFGGFAGTETRRADRNWAPHLTILSGDIGVVGLNTDNSNNVVWAEGVSNARLDGFTITGGYGGYGAGIYTWNHSSPVLANLVIRDNVGIHGGGLYNNYYGEPTLTNVVMTGNSATQSGGAIYNYSSWPYLFDVTISGNSAATAGGGVYNSYSPNWTMFNTIAWGNTAAGVPSQIAGDAILAEHSIIQGASGYSGSGNLDADPLFVNPAAGDLRVRGDSPAIDAGNNSAVRPDAADLDGDGDTGEPVPCDLTKAARFVDVPFVSDTGVGDPPLVDIGAYEYSPLPPVANAGGPYAGNESATIAFTASASTDPNGDLLLYRWDFDGDGQWDTAWSSDPSATHSWGEPQFAVVTVQVSDGHASSTASAAVEIGNLPPVAQDDTYEADEDHELIVPAPGVLANDQDPGGGAVHVVQVDTNGILGTVTWQADGSFTYDPRGQMDWLAQGGLAEGTVVYQIQDTQGAEATATVRVQIRGINDPPEAQNDALAAIEDREIVVGPGALLANDSDVDSDPLAVTGVSDPQHGTVWLTSPATGLTVTGLWDVTSGNFSESAVTPDGKTLYVTGGNGSNLVTVIDVATRQVLRTITLPGSLSARAIAITPAGSPYPKRAYVGRMDGPIDIIDLEPTSPTYHTVVKSITDWGWTFGVPSGGRPDVIAFTPDGSKVYVSNESAPNPVTSINAATETVLARINLASLGYPQAASTGLAVSPDGTRVYVQFQFDSGGIAVINTATDAPLSKINLSANGSRIAVTPDGRRAYTVAWNQNVLVVDVTTNQQVKTIPIAGYGHWVGISPDGERLMVGATSPNSQVIDTNPSSPTYETVIANLPGNTGYTGITFSPYGHETYATGNGLKIVGNFQPELHFQPAANFHGSAGFRYAIADGQGGTEDAMVTVSVAPVNDPPTLTMISTLAGATEDTDFTISYAMLSAAADEADVDGDSLSFRVESVTSGTLTKGGVAVTPGVTLLGPGESLVWRSALNAYGVLGAFRTKAWDGVLASATAVQVAVNVAAVNDAPSDISLTGTSVAENLPAGTVVGTFATTDPDSGNTFSYSLITGDGSTDNGSFTIDGTQLKTAAVLDYETKNSYWIRVRTTDQGGLWYEEPLVVTVTDVNETPVLARLDGDDELAVDESLVALPDTTGDDFDLVAADVDMGQTLQFTLEVVDPGDPGAAGATPYDPSNPDHAAVLQVTIPIQTPQPGGSPGQASTATGKLRVQAGPNAAGNEPSKTWCFRVRASDDGTPHASDTRLVRLVVTRRNATPALQAVDGDNLMATDESLVPLQATAGAYFPLAADDVDILQTLQFTMFVPDPDHPAAAGATRYDPSNPEHAGLLEIAIAAQTPAPGSPPAAASTATGTLRVQAGPNAAGDQPSKAWCFGVQVTDDGGESHQRTVRLTVNRTNVAPVADAGGPYVSDRYADLVLDGSATSDLDLPSGDAIVRYEWDFDSDGSYEYSDTSATVTVPWADLATRPSSTPIPIRLRVTDSFGDTDEDATTLTIYDNRPFANFTAAPNPCACEQSVSFDAGGSYHGRPGRMIMKYEWDFDYAGGSFDADAEGMTPTYIYPRFGSYTVALRVTDDNAPAKTDVTTHGIAVNQGNLPPLADPGGVYDVHEGSGLTLDGSSSSDSNVGCGDSITYAWDLDGDGFDDGDGPLLGLTPQAMRSLGLGDGPVQHSVRLRVTDTFGATNTQSALIRVANVAPTLSDLAATSPVAEGGTMHLTGVRRDVSIDDSLWTIVDWGDDSPPERFTSPGGETSFDVTHVYTDDDPYTVTVTVEDDDGGMTNDTLMVTAGNVAPVVDAGGDQTTVEGTTVSFSGSFTDAGSADTHTIAWTFGDGGTGSGTLAPTHVYADNGVYTVTLTVTDDDGGATSDTLVVTVNDFVVPVPYAQEFSGGKPNQGWDYYSTGEGRIEVVNGKLRMDDFVKGGLYSLNEAILHVNLVGHGNVQLKLDHQTFGDETHRYSPVQFANHVNADLIAVSLNGINWVKVTDLTTSFTRKSFELDALLQQAELAAGTTDRSDVRIKFQQYDNDPWGTSSTSSDGRAFDNIQVTAIESLPLKVVTGKAPSATSGQVLTRANLGPLVEAAIGQWADTGLPGDQIRRLQQVQFVITDLPGSDLGRASLGTIYLDADAAGYGWFVDATPHRSEEFRAIGPGDQLNAVDSRAVDRIDLFTVVSHELGHIAGLDDLAVSVDGLMSSRLAPGIRRAITAADVDAVLASGKVCVS